MDILKKLDNYLFEKTELITESGIKNIKELAKTHDEAEIYFHVDLDGVTSAIAIKEYLKQYGIKTVDAHTIQYGDSEYIVPKPKDKTLHVLVDFAHGKGALMQIHTDHHEGQVGVDPTTSTSFVKAPANSAYISSIISTTDIFPPSDIKIISTVDSADFASQGITPDDVMRAAFSLDPDIDVGRNKLYMGLVANKLLLTYKNKPKFLIDLVLMAKPSLTNIYTVIKYLAKKAGYATPEDITTNQKAYVGAQKISKNVNMIDNIIVQYGGGSMIKPGSYDRYTPFKNNPDADFFCMAWPVGLVQLSKNPFKKGKNPYHLGNIAMGVLEKYKGQLQKKKVTLDFIKWTFEKKAIEESIGFTYNDLIALFKDKIKGKNSEEVMQLAINKKYSELTDEDKGILKSFYITAWDIITSQSGGHKDITNMSGWNFIGKGYVDIMKAFQSDLVAEMKGKRLE